MNAANPAFGATLPLAHQRPALGSPVAKVTQTFAKVASLASWIAVSGCAVQSTRLAQDDYHTAQQRSAEFQTHARQPQALPPMVTADIAPRFARHSIPLQRAASLPTHIGNVTLRYPGRQSLVTVAELISRLIDIPVIMTPDALNSASDYAPGGLNAATQSAQARTDDLQTASARLAAMAGASTLAISAQELQNSIELDYSGPLAGLLNLVATRAGLQWEYAGGKIVFSRLVTRSIMVKALPNGLKTTGSLDVFGSNNGGGGGDSGGSGGGGSGGGGGNSSNTGSLKIDFETDSNYWAGLTDSLKGMLSARAQLQVDPRSGLVTVTDALTNVERVETFLKEINVNLLRQVALEVEVLQVNLSDQYSNGINWQAVLGKLNGNQLTLTGPQGGGALSGNTPGSLSFILAPSSSRDSPSRLMAESLQEYGKVATSYSSVVTTTNRMPVPVGSLQTRSYVRQTTAATVNATTGITTPGSLVPGSISTGLGLMILPVILDSNRILLQTVMQVSELRELKSFTSGTGTTSQSIQLPDTVSFSSLQRTSVPAGQTLVLIGYEREQSQADDTDIVRGLLPIAKRGARAKQGTVILITPRLSEN
ncbi:secretin N-terminal domain-containing protein [Roseateles amylovorans]|uniref:Secretin N-terminal domain-containing protein n=1 Tax=Roseateles amylovorans TaxID=2978473 RepID=A0ABY6B5F1_9BURK|nr:secretin N-terminal domain-containing protein [Roseateles amylovorans]UXH80277.1 secretin N-terminal domain-containing protein [Roseateles amylovorans]